MNDFTNDSSDDLETEFASDSINNLASSSSHEMDKRSSRKTLKKTDNKTDRKTNNRTDNKIGTTDISTNPSKKRKKKPVLYITLLLLNIMYVIGIIFVVFYYLEFKSDLNSKGDNTNMPNSSVSGSIEATTPSLNQFAQNGLSNEDDFSIYIPQSDPVSDEYFNDILFLGDSRFVSMEAYGTVPKRCILAENGISAGNFYTSSFFNEDTGTVQSLPEFFDSRNPKIIYIALGVNGAGFLPAETVVSDVAKIATLAKETCPDSVIVIQSILPVSDIKTEVSPNLTNEKIDACNDLLIDLATENNYLYMDLSPIMKNSEGKLHADYDYGDGLHFNENAYIVMKNYWRTHEIVTN